VKKQFSDISRQGPWQGLQRWIRQGHLQLYAGVGLVLVVAFAGLCGALYTEQLDAGDPAEGYHPPHNSLLQTLLYRPPLRVDTVRGGGGPGGAIQMGAGMTTAPDDQSTSLASDSSVPRITSRPHYTAVVGEPYQYEVQVQSDGSQSRFELEERPSGMKIDASGRIQWTPRESVEPEVDVEVRVLNDEDWGTRQRFTVHVSETSHPLGTEKRGRDMGAALLLGARWALLPGCVAVLVSMVLGGLVGGLAGYYEGSTRLGLTYTSSVTEALPSLVIFFLAALIFQRNIFWIMGVVGLLRAPRVASAVKSKVESLKARQFVEAARELGLRDRVILWRDIVWYNARPQLLLQASYGFVFAIIVEVTLSYLRLGIEAPAISWGNLLSAGRGQLASHVYWPVILPALAIILAVGAFYFLADGIGRRYDL